LRRWLGVASTIAALALYPLLILPLVCRNVRMTGHLGGLERAVADRGVVANLRDVLVGLFDAVPLTRALVAGPAGLMASASILLAITAAAIVFKKRGRESADDELPVASPTVVVMQAFVLAYVALLVSLRSITQFNPIGVRLLLPALVALVLLLIGVAHAYADSDRRAILATGWILMSAIATGASAVMLPNWRFFNNRSEHERPVIRWARGSLACAEHRPLAIFTDNPEAIHFATGQAVHMLPPVSKIERLRASAHAGYFVFVIADPDFSIAGRQSRTIRSSTPPCCGGRAIPARLSCVVRGCRSNG
jgi:hypothetical protein